MVPRKNHLIFNNFRKMFLARQAWRWPLGEHLVGFIVRTKNLVE